MPELPIGKDVSTVDDFFDVTPTTAVPLAVGLHTFQLIVVDAAGNKSDPQIAKVFVVDDQKPTAKLTAIPEKVPFGQPVRLSGKGSADVGSGITTFIWTRID